MSDSTGAYSIDGRTFGFRVAVSHQIQPGAYVSLSTPDGDRLGQVLGTRAAEGASFAEPWVEGSGRLLTPGAPFTGGSLQLAAPDAVAGYLGPPDGAGMLELGELADIEGVPAAIRAAGFGRHTFVCGQSGSGKTYATGKLLEQILHRTNLRVVILDPNSDYVRLDTLVDRSETGLSRKAYRELADRHAEIAEGIQVMGREQLRLWLGNLGLREQATVLGIDPVADGEEAEVALDAIDALGTTRYGPLDLVEQAEAHDPDAASRLRRRIRGLGLDRMGIWASEEHPAIVDRLGDDWRVAVLDLGSLPTPRERSIVSAAVISGLWRRRHSRDPVLLVIDEAHNVSPQTPTEANQALATDELVTIAAEGRKFGIYLLAATQRPSKVHENVLSQCDNLLLMRMNSRRDVNYLQEAFSAVPSALIERASTFQLGEGLAWGKIAPDPILFRTGRRVTAEGGSDVPTTWLNPG